MVRYLLGLTLLILSWTAKSQTVKSIELCNQTQSLLYFGEASSHVNHFLLKEDDLSYSFIHFSDSCKITKSDFIKLSRTFRQVASKHGMKEFPPMPSKKISVDNNLWHERNYYYKDTRANKYVQIMQVVVTFEGNDVNKEKVDPRVRDVKLFVGDKIVNRGKYLL
jgi:hypothetical protein